VFFSAVFFNYICIVSTCVVIFYTTKKFFNDSLLSFLAGLLYLLGFGTIFYEMMPITDALSVLLFSVVLLNYLTKSYFILVPFLLLVLQREYIFMAVGLIALVDYIRIRDIYFLY